VVIALVNLLLPTLSGILSLQDALHLIAIRARLVSELPTGSMLSVRLSEEQLAPLLPKPSLAAVNSSVLCRSW
jgi:acyl transferase domain-containing protein